MKRSTFKSKRSIVIVVVILFLILAFGVNQLTQGSTVSPLTGDHHVQIDQPKATTTLNKSFTFPVMDQQGQKAGELVYTIKSVELRDEVLIRGQKADAVSGKNFVVLRVQIQNKLNQSININARDYVRLSVDNKKNWLAPDIYNDPVQAQAIAIVYTQLGFTVDSNDTKNLVLQVGEINGPKQYITFSF